MQVGPGRVGVVGPDGLALLLRAVLERLVAEVRVLPVLLAVARRGLLRLDHVVDEAAAAGDERVGEAVLIFLRPLRDRFGVAVAPSTDSSSET